MDLGATETRLPSAPASASDRMAFTPGTVLADRYRIVSTRCRPGETGHHAPSTSTRLKNCVAPRRLARAAWYGRLS